LIPYKEKEQNWWLDNMPEIKIASHTIQVLPVRNAELLINQDN